MKRILLALVVLLNVVFIAATDAVRVPKRKKYTSALRITDDVEETMACLKAQAKAAGIELEPARKRVTPIPRTVRRRRYYDVPSQESRGWHVANCSWYGPGLYGNHTANGEILTPGSMNFAHLRMPFGTRVEFLYNGRSAIARCNDRGPYVRGRVFDLGPGTAAALGFNGVGIVRWRYVN